MQTGIALGPAVSLRPTGDSNKGRIRHQLLRRAKRHTNKTNLQLWDKGFYSERVDTNIKPRSRFTSVSYFSSSSSMKPLASTSRALKTNFTFSADRAFSPTTSKNFLWSKLSAAVYKKHTSADDINAVDNIDSFPSVRKCTVRHSKSVR